MLEAANNYVKSFFRDFLDLTSQHFFQKYFSLPVTILFAWITCGSVLEMNYEIKNLNKITGKVEYNEVFTTRIINKTLYKGREQELRLKLQNHPEYFRLTDNFLLGEVAEKIAIGDTATIYYRSLFQTILGFGRQFDIYQVDYHKKTLVDVGVRQENAKGIATIGVMATMLALLNYLYQKRRRE